MSKPPNRPSILDDMIVRPDPPPAPAVAPESPADPRTGRLPHIFRSTVYFHRAVHDVLRDIAHAERGTMMDLINEGLEHVLKKRSYPSMAEIKAGVKSRHQAPGTPQQQDDTASE